MWTRLTAPPGPDQQIEFSSAERVTLELACRQADDIARLEELLEADGSMTVGSKGQPKLSSVPAELRLQRAALARLVALLAIPDEGEQHGLSPASRNARHAARVRHSRDAAKRGARRGAAG